MDCLLWEVCFRIYECNKFFFQALDYSKKAEQENSYFLLAWIRCQHIRYKTYVSMFTCKLIVKICLILHCILSSLDILIVASRVTPRCIYSVFWKWILLSTCIFIFVSNFTNIYKIYIDLFSNSEVFLKLHVLVHCYTCTHFSLNLIHEGIKFITACIRKLMFAWFNLLNILAGIYPDLWKMYDG